MGYNPNDKLEARRIQFKKAVASLKKKPLFSDHMLDEIFSAILLSESMEPELQRAPLIARIRAKRGTLQELDRLSEYLKLYPHSNQTKRIRDVINTERINFVFEEVDLKLLRKRKFLRSDSLLTVLSGLFAMSGGRVAIGGGAFEQFLLLIYNHYDEALRRDHLARSDDAWVLRAKGTLKTLKRAAKRALPPAKMVPKPLYHFS